MTAVTTVALTLALAQAQPQPPAAPALPPPAAAQQPPQARPQPPAPAAPEGQQLPTPSLATPEPSYEVWLDQAARANLPPITLDEALKTANVENLDLMAARARLQEAYQAAWKAWSYYLPQVSGNGTYTRNDIGVSLPFPTSYTVRSRTPGGAGEPPPDPATGLPGGYTGTFAFPLTVENITIQKLDQLSAVAQANQALFAPQLFFQIPNAYRSQHVAELTVEGVRQDVLFGVAQAYYAVASLKQAVEVGQRLLEIAQRQENDATVRYKAGTIAKVGLIRAQIDRARAEQDLRRTRNNFLSAKVGLSVLLDRAPDFDVVDPPQPQIDQDPATLVRRVSEHRTDVLAAKTNVEIAYGSRNAVVASYLPNVGAFGRIMWANVTGFTGQQTTWAVGVGLTWNIFDGGLREANLREANARIDETEAASRSAVLKAEGDVRQALLDMQSARANAAKAKEQRDLAAENQRLVDVSYRAGAATAVEQADATAALRNAEITLTTESLNAQLQVLRVLRLAGVFVPVPASYR